MAYHNSAGGQQLNNTESGTQVNIVGATVTNKLLHARIQEYGHQYGDITIGGEAKVVVGDVHNTFAYSEEALRKEQTRRMTTTQLRTFADFGQCCSRRFTMIR